MYIVTKSKRGKDFKTNDLQSAINGYVRNKRSLSLWNDNDLLLTRIEYLKIKGLPIWEYLQKQGRI